MSEMTGSSLIERKDFSKIPRHLDIPDLIEIQKRSYDSFLQMEIDPDRREDKGLQAALTSVFPIADYNSTAVLEFVNYSLGTPKYDVRECMEQGMSYAAPLKIRVRLVVLDKEDKSPTKKVLDVREQEVYIGELPLMTERGTFIINGTERVVVSQLHRSPGAFFTHDKGRTHASGKILFSARIIPYRGSWLDFEFDTRDILYVRIDRRRKMPATILLKAFGYTTDDLLRMYYPVEEIHVQKGKLWRKLDPEIHAGLRVPDALVEKGSKEPIVREGSKLTKATIGRLKAAGIKEIEVNPEDLVGHTVLVDLVDSAIKEKILEKNHKLTAEVLKKVLASKIDVFKVVFHDGTTTASVIEDTLESEKTTSKEEAMVEIYKRLRPGETPSIETARALFDNLFFNPKRYDLSPVGRLKLNKKLGLDLPLEKRTLTAEDIIEVVRYLVNLKSGKGDVDDIDHLGNRRVRSVGELLENQFRLGLVRMERSIRERMNLLDMEAVLPHDLINAKPVIAAIKEFFASSQLSQFMDQTNPLAEITHKRRLSALGPGGLTREREGFEVRDVHPSHYSRICPIETPEGPNIGLITSLATYARVNEFGFIEAPYRKVRKGKVTDEIEHLSAIDGDRYHIAQANSEVGPDGRLIADLVSARYGGDFVLVHPDKVEYMDVSPKQTVSVATALIPFLEHDDANRALMGSNMQRQAVPLIVTEAPIVGTGMESPAAKDSGELIVARVAGTIVSCAAPPPADSAAAKLDSFKREFGILLKPDDGSAEQWYAVHKFERSNQGTCLSQRVIVKAGDHVAAGTPLADGPATSEGELALGRNILVAFMPWEGYNYEDAILISESVVREDKYTSIHIEEYEIEARDTKLGPEEITRDIPNVSDETLKNLDERGIVYIGAEVHPGDILVGKITPKGESELSAEERLLRAIFGEKAREVRDSSLRVPHGERGIVVDVKIFSRETKDELAPGVNQLVRVYVAQKRKIAQGDKMAGRHGNKGVIARILPTEDMPYMPDGTPVELVLNPLGVPSRMNLGQVLETHLGWAAHALGLKVATPVFDGASEETIEAELVRSGLPESGKITLRDGRTGEAFDHDVTVGYIYMLKLAHLVEDKIHARSTGPYSLVTQQPLGGKAQFGGQRFGEMEVWALEAYGAAHVLQEILTVKSDDIVGRVKAYEAIVKGDNTLEAGIPESFRVLVKELEGLALGVEILSEDERQIVLSEEDIPEIPLDLGISLEREELGEDSAE